MALGRARDEKFELRVSVIWVVGVIGGNIHSLHRAVGSVYGHMNG